MLVNNVLFRGNDNDVEFDFPNGGFLKDARTGLAVTAATVSVRILDVNDVVLQASVSMPAVSGEGGNYRGTIPDTLDLSAFEEVVAEVTADDGPGSLAVWLKRMFVEDRDC